MPDPPPSDFASIQASITSALVGTTRATTRLCAEDLPFYRSLDRNVAKTLDEQQKALLVIAQTLLKNAASGTDITIPSLIDGEGVEGLEKGWRDIVDVLDGLLEKADSALDEYKALVKKGENGQEAPVQATGIAAASSAMANGRSRIPRNLDIPKPQETFEDSANNTLAGPFKPILMSKPNALLPFEQSLKLEAKNFQTSQLDYSSPYEQEIISYRYPAAVLAPAEPINYLPFDKTSAIYVDTEDKLAEMLVELKKVKEIAIDLEHHDTRSYIGLVSLMQISTRNQDWIIDTLKPWRRKLQCLNEVFTDSTILKVLHGAQSDVVWLQRDFGLYLVGLFDTYHACRALRYPGASLAFLLKKFCNYDAQKQYQTADWRIR
jgi:exosome complex exonuclease RRP6